MIKAKVSKYKLGFLSIIITLMLGIGAYVSSLNQLYLYIMTGFFILLSSILCLSCLKKEDLKNPITQNLLVWLLIITILVIQLANSLLGKLSIEGGFKALGMPLAIMYSVIIVPTFLYRFNLFKTLLKFFSLAGSFIALTSIIYTFQSVDLSNITFVKLQYYQWLNFDHIIDSNYQAAIETISTISAVYLFLQKGQKWWWLSVFLLNMLGMLIAASRASLLAVAVSLFIYFYFSLRTKAKVFLLTVTSIISLLIIINYSSLIEIHFINQILDLDRGSTGRLELWSTAIEVIMNYPLNGIGSNSFILTTQSLSRSSSHNSFLDYMINNGVVAGLIYIALIGYVLIQMWKQKSRTVAHLISMVIGVIVVMMFTTHNIGGISYMSQIVGIIIGTILIHSKKNSI